MYLLIKKEIKMNILFSNKVSPSFVSKVQDISNRLGIDPNWLMFIMFSESGLNPYATNSIGATGLIQFLPSTAIGLGTTTDALLKMSAEEQLNYVYEYFKPYRSDLDSVYDMYLAAFYPGALDEEDSYVFPANVVAQNKIFFKTGPTLADFRMGVDAIIYSKVPTAYYNVLIKKKEIFCRSIKKKLFSEV